MCWLAVLILVATALVNAFLLYDMKKEAERLEALLLLSQLEENSEEDRGEGEAGGAGEDVA